MASTPKDEAAVSRELAALLLNLHDSNGGIARSSHASSTISNITTTNKSNVASTTASDFNKAEDLSLKSVAETAIDLTKAKPEITLTPTMPASITKLVKGTGASNNGLSAASNSGMTVTKTSVKATNYPSASSNGIMPATSTASSNNGYSSAASYPFYPSLASMASLSPTLAMNSNYLLQNLLLGKFQQIANSSSNSSSSNNTQSSSSASTANNGASTSVSSNMALPTHPLPAQTLSLPASKPPASVLKTAASSTPGSGNSNSSAMSNGSNGHDRAAGSYNLQLMADTASGSNGGGTSSSTSSMPASSSSAANNAGGGPTSQIDIPYMCRQIVTLLNGLLFHQHNLNNPNVELNVHTQLGAIYARLQEVVVMVEQAKKQQEAIKVTAATASAVAKKDEKHLKDNKQKEEEKIAKHIHEYQRLLQKQHEKNTKSQSDLVTQVTNDLKSQNAVGAAQAAVVSAAVQAVSAVASSVTANSTGDQVDVVDSMQETDNLASDLVSMKNRRRGRPPKNSNIDLSYSPPEKKLRMPLADVAGNPHQQPEIGSTGKYSMANSSINNDPTSPMVE